MSTLAGIWGEKKISVLTREARKKTGPIFAQLHDPIMPNLKGFSASKRGKFRGRFL